ncbi:Peptidoglycan-N-acetylglucosamine deacetylase [Xylophilus ampelinus]|uniref:Polysaccharide deacetylase family protein n=1 Tax=Variovorax paradoxus TaxID=34073 RepID=A0A2W5QN86_VARPD|nr:MAG: polysaccharide deacetylase family protein [Variovorax paradoxus]VTY39067.1 Peptidoglycan-N-acetylglucosamine deacetylase [Xylophilus ampelinus]
MTRLITLSFDNGPTPGVTDMVLEALDRHGISATFFVLGKNLQTSQSRDLMALAAQRGHWIGNHTFHHDIPFGENPDPRAVEAEIESTQALIGKLSHPDRLFRPFGKGGLIGHHLLSCAAADHLLANHYTCVLWNAIPRDWENVYDWPDIALGQCRAQNWSLIVLHDYDTGAMKQLDNFICRAVGEGMQFVQAFPPDCVPIRRGQPQTPLDAIVARSVNHYNQEQRV